MKDYEKEIEKIFLDDEEDTLRRIKITYDNALVDVQKHVDKLQTQIDELMKDVDENDLIKQSQIRSKVYQLDYQKNLKKQINNYLDVIKDKDVKTIGDYLKRTYSNGFLTEQYRLMNEGIDIVMPINQKLLEKAVTYNTNNIPLSKRIYDNVEKAKKEIVNEISRSLSTGMSIDDTARNLQNTMGVSQRKAYQIAQNEGSRVRSDAVIDEMRESKKKGADIVKVWTAILDGKVRPHHRELDGKWAEVEGYFKYSGGEVFAPKQFGIASEDINCRCSLLSKPRWDLTETHTQMDSVSKKLVVVKNYQDWFDNVYTPSQTIVEKATKEVVKKVTATATATATTIAKTNSYILKTDDLGNMFNSSTKNQKNAQMVVDYINNQNVDDNIKKLFVDLDDGRHSLKYGKRNEVALDHITLVDLTKDNSVGATFTNIHEMTHLKDLIKGGNIDMFSTQERFASVVAKTTGTMSDKIKKVFEEAKEVYKQIEADVYKDVIKMQDELMAQRFILPMSEYKKRDKQLDKLWNECSDKVETLERNLGVCGLEDIYDALSGGELLEAHELEFGHGASYYFDESKRTNEILANYTALSVVRPDLVELLKEDKPELTNMLDELIAELIK